MAQKLSHPAGDGYNPTRHQVQHRMDTIQHVTKSSAGWIQSNTSPSPARDGYNPTRHQVQHGMDTIQHVTKSSTGWIQSNTSPSPARDGYNPTRHQVQHISTSRILYCEQHCPDDSLPLHARSAVYVSSCVYHVKAGKKRTPFCIICVGIGTSHNWTTFCARYINRLCKFLSADMVSS